MAFESYENPFISYAQAREDVILIRSLRDIPPEDGFYIDVGVFDPNEDSVTKVFYEAGWHGINIEPSPQLFRVIAEARPRDINLEVAASSEVGELNFFYNDGHQLGTVDPRYAHDPHNFRRVQALTLSQICEQHVSKEIHFLKIDVEGHELGVLQGMDFTRFRPWILVIESVAPNTHIATYSDWEPIVLSAGYIFVLADAINRYYVAVEHNRLAANFSLQADNFIHIRELHALKLERDRCSRLEEENARLKSAIQTDRASNERRPFLDLWKVRYKPSRSPSR